MLDKKYKWGWLDWLLTGFIFVIALATLFYLKNIRSFDYHWAWDKIGHFFFNYSKKGNLQAGPFLIGLSLTFKLAFWSFIVAFFLGSIMGIISFSRIAILRYISIGYVQLVRNIPPLVFVLLFYYLFSDQLIRALGLENLYNISKTNSQIISFLFFKPDLLGAFISAIIIMALYEGAYITEIIRGGIESLPVGQWHASSSIGFNKAQTYRYVILPQVYKNNVPVLINQLISTIKDTAIVSVISIPELTFQGNQVMASTNDKFLESSLTVVVLYFSLTFTSSLLVKFFFRKRYFT